MNKIRLVHYTEFDEISGESFAVFENMKGHKFEVSFVNTNCAKYEIGKIIDADIVLNSADILQINEIKIDENRYTYLKDYKNSIEERMKKTKSLNIWPSGYTTDIEVTVIEKNDNDYYDYKVNFDIFPEPILMELSDFCDDIILKPGDKVRLNSSIGIENDEAFPL